MTFCQHKIYGLAAVIGLLAAVGPVSAQSAEAAGQGNGTWWVAGASAVLIGLGGRFLYWRHSHKRREIEGGSASESYSNADVYEMDSLDVDKELEWLRKARASGQSVSGSKPLPRITMPSPPKVDTAILPSASDTRAFQERMRNLRYAQLPINAFINIKPARVYEPLPISDDPGLINAIEQANEEFEEDESIRELAIKILAAFRFRNAVDSLSQIALYDLSANLRSKAIIALTDFEHPSVFEPILLACADPTREVKAAAARGLFRLSFDRADAWKRLMETGDPFRMRHAAHAAIESGIAVKSFDRLVHDDMKIAYEAFALTAFLIESGATTEIFKAIESHKDQRVSFALVHTLRVIHNERALTQLVELSKAGKLSPDINQRVQEAVVEIAVAV